MAVNTYKITYIYGGKENWTYWYGTSKDKTLALFKSWHPGLEVVRIERVKS